MLINTVHPPPRTHGEVRQLLARVLALFLSSTALGIALLSGAHSVISREREGPMGGGSAEIVSNELKLKEALLTRLQAAARIKETRIEALRFPRRFFDELGVATPNGVQLEKVSVRGTRVEIAGASLTERELDELITNLSATTSISNPTPLSLRGTEIESTKIKKISITAEMAKPDRFR